MVKKKLSQPAEVIEGVPDRVRGRWTYPAKGIDVEFQTTDPDPQDSGAPLALIVLYQPKPEKKD